MKKETLNNNLNSVGNESNSALNRLVSKPLEYNKIYNGDSFELCERVPAKTVDLILEDMPYNTTACEWDVRIDLELYWKTRLRMLKPTGVVVLTASQPFTTDLIYSNYKMFKYEWIWDKCKAGNIFLADKQPMKIHENILVFGERILYKPIKIKRDKKKVSKNYGTGATMGGNYEKEDKIYTYDDKYPESILQISNAAQTGKEHPTQKPVGLFEYLIRTYTNEGDLVFDGFGGSGTTAIAAYKAKRNFIVIEKEQKYFDLAKRRLDVERAQYTIF